jgi:hypothetical protein
VVNAPAPEVVMSERSPRWICLAALAASAAGVVVGALRWLGSSALVQQLEPLGRTPVFLGVVAPLCAYAIVQMLPGGRAPLWLVRPPNDGWTIALSLTMLCATLAMFPARRGAPVDSLFALPFILTSAGFLVDRLRRVQRELGPSASS